MRATNFFKVNGNKKVTCILNKKNTVEISWLHKEERMFGEFNTYRMSQDVKIDRGK